MLSLIKQLRLNDRSQQGDTIVEVMIVLAILGFAMGISYATASANLKSTRQAQETSQASSLVESQIEAVRNLAPTTQSLFNSSRTFCVDTSDSIIDAPSSSCLGLITNAQPTYTLTVNYCSTSVSYATDSPCYHVADSTFVAKASWPDVAGQGTDSSTLVYRIYKNEYYQQ